MPSYWRTWLGQEYHGIARYQSLTYEGGGVIEQLEAHAMRVLRDNPELLTRVAPERASEFLSLVKEAAAEKTRLSGIATSGSAGEKLAALGGAQWEGALPLVNKNMLNYQDASRLDDVMRGFIPFWMFPSRSIPYWLGQFVEKPWMVTAYRNYLDTSRRASYRSGAVTSRGDQLNSAVGYMPVQAFGTTLWINPLAPLSARYALPLQAIMYDDPNEDQPMVQQVSQHMYDFGRVYGFYLGPWITQPAYAAGFLDANKIPPYSLVSQMDLVPQWTQRSIQEKLIQMGLPDMPWAWTPEASWKDNIIEVEMVSWLAQELQKTENIGEQQKLINDVKRAIGYVRDLDAPSGYRLTIREDDPLWVKFRRQVELSDYYRGTFGYFTGIYPKEFTDAKMELLSLRDRLNYYRDAVNNLAKADIFALDPDDGARYDFYIHQKFDNLETYPALLYGNLNYVRTPEGEKPYGMQRRELIAQDMHRDQLTTEYYKGVEMLNAWMTEQLAHVDIGDTKARGLIRTEFFRRRDVLENDPQYMDAKRDWTFGYKPAQRIEDYFENQWWRYVSETRPAWKRDDGQTYAQWQAELAEWEIALPSTGAGLMQVFFDERMEAFRVADEQTGVVPTGGIPVPGGRLFYPEEMAKTLLQQTNPDGFHAHERSNDTPLDAFNSAYNKLYYSQYWDSFKGLNPDQPDYAEQRKIREQDFLAKHPQPPTFAEYVAHINAEYGNKFTLDELKAAYEGRQSMDIDKKLAPATEEGLIAEKVWDMLFNVGPGPNFNAFKDAFIQNGGDPDMINSWYDVQGKVDLTNEKWLDFADKVVQTVQELGFEQPTRTQLLERAEAKRWNSEFQTGITRRFGEDFRIALTAYSNMSAAEKRDYRLKDPGYAEIKEYYELKDWFAEQHPVWAKYYNPTAFDEKKAAGTSTGLVGSGTSRAGGGGGGGARAPVRKDPVNIIAMGYRGTLDPRKLLGPLGKGGVAKAPWWPPGLWALVGAQAAKEIEAAVDKGEPVSEEAKAFLHGVAKRHPEHAKFLNRVTGGGGGGPVLKM